MGYLPGALVVIAAAGVWGVRTAKNQGYCDFGDVL